MTCFICGKPLAGGLDTFGPPEMPLCQACYWQALLLGEQAEARRKKEAAEAGISVPELEAWMKGIPFNENDADKPFDRLRAGIDALYVDRLEA